MKKVVLVLLLSFLFTAQCFAQVKNSKAPVGSATNPFRVPQTSASLTRLDTNGDFLDNANGWTLGTGWAWGSGRVTKTAGSTGTLSQAINVTSGDVILVRTYCEPSAGAFFVKADGVTLNGSLWPVGASSQYGSLQYFASFIYEAAATAAVTFAVVPEANTFAGVCEAVSVYKVSPNTTPVLAGVTALGTAIEVRGDAASTHGIASNGAGQSIGVGLHALKWRLSESYDGWWSSAFGQSALEDCVTCYESTAVGAAALTKNRTGMGNSAFGAWSMFENKWGHYHAAFGDDSMGDVTGGSECSAFGAWSATTTSSGYPTYLTGCEHSVFIGANNGSKNSTSTNEIVIGAYTSGAGDNTAVIGNADVTDAYFGSATGASKAHASAYYIGASTAGCSGSPVTSTGGVATTCSSDAAVRLDYVQSSVQAITDYRPMAYGYANNTCGQSFQWEWNGFGSGLPTFGMIASSTSQKCAAAFLDASVNHIQTTILIPDTTSAANQSAWATSFKATIYWTANVSNAGLSAVWQAKTACSSTGDLMTTAFGSAATVTSAAHASANVVRSATITLDVTGCARGDIMAIDIYRDGAHASDNLAATAQVLGVSFSYPR